MICFFLLAFSFCHFLSIKVNCTRHLTRFCILFYFVFSTHQNFSWFVCMYVSLWMPLQMFNRFFFYFFIVFHSYYFFASLLFLCLYTNIYIFHSFLNYFFFTDYGCFCAYLYANFCKTSNLATLKLSRRKLSGKNKWKHMKVNHVLCLLTIILHIPSHNNYRLVATIIML